MTLQRLKFYLLHSFFPHRCCACGRIFDEARLFCSDCIKEIRPLKGDLCKVCLNDRALCTCKKHPKWYRQSTAPFVYDGAIRGALLRFKRYGDDAFGTFAAQHMAQAMEKSFQSLSFDVIIPVPMHRSKRRKVGFNHSELLAQKLSEITGVPVDTKTLTQCKKAKPQHNLAFSERKENINGIYRAKPLPEPLTVLLVDDIITTGFTLSECAKQLRFSGAKAVYTVGVAKNSGRKQPKE